MSEDLELLPEPEKARAKARDRKLRGPRVVVDNAGLRKVAMDVAQRRRKSAEADSGSRRPRSQNPGRG